MKAAPILWAMVPLGVGLLAPSCTASPPAADCEQACAVASRCGLLPSALGGAVGDSRARNQQSCVERCIASEASDPQVSGLIERLGDRKHLPDDALCSMEGTHACEELIMELEDDPDTSELEVTTTLTIRMVNLVSYVTSDSLGSWCCFDHRYDFDSIGDGVDELDAVRDMFEPTRACLEELQAAAGAASEASATIEMLEMTIPMADPEQLQDARTTLSMQCQALLDRWRMPPPDEPAGDCAYARSSTRMGALPIPGTAEECEALGAMGHGSLAEQIGRLQMELHLEPGDFLFDDDGKLRGLEDMRAQVQGEVHTKLANRGAPLESACREAIGTPDDSGCSTLDRDALAEPPVCDGGPACSPDDCLDVSPGCDTTLCDARRSPPGRDCGELGITEVRLGYRDFQGLEVLGDPIGGCEALTEVVTTFERVKVGKLVPVAVVSGVLPTFLSHDASSGSFSWIVHGEAQWVTAGAAELEVPSPMLEWSKNVLENPLEMLGWVPRRLPIGKPCYIEPEQCEGYFNNNCDNGIDDDGDGLTDGDSAWCDELMHTLSDRCVVTEPGREAPMGCPSDMAP